VTSIDSSTYPTQGDVTVTIQGDNFGVGNPDPTVAFIKDGYGAQFSLFIPYQTFSYGKLIYMK